ncbi:MAG: NAD(P)/FAD-dependent oxidoreductase [Actinobacteria bacterium]|nr:NAD(P)/FAD-dependent oxidoreductase [Actinomycetota bacterium]
MSERYDAVVVGSGPNGLTAAVALARADRHVLVLEGADTVGGGTRSAELTLPGFTHDVCSAAHPMGISSPYLRTLPLEEHGLRWLHAEVPLAHPLDHGVAAVMRRELDVTAEGLGGDGAPWRRTLEPFVRRFDALLEDITRPMVQIPRHPFLLARFGLLGLRSAAGIARRFRTDGARALMAGIAAHAVLPLEHLLSASAFLMLGAAGHAYGWPVAAGGSQAIADALTALLRDLGGQVRTGAPVRTMADIPPADAVVFDTNPAQLLAIVGDDVPSTYARRLRRYRRGPGAFKVDYALDGPVPWLADECAGAGTVHLGGTFEELTRAERAVARGEVVDRPFVLAVQASAADPSRAPDGKHTLWTYCHVPNGWDGDATDRIERQIERYAPGFRDLVLARHVFRPADLEAYNPNYVGGDFAGGASDGLQLFARPVLSPDPYATPIDGVYLCSAATPPGGGVHGMGGFHAARSLLKRQGGKRWR